MGNRFWQSACLALYMDREGIYRLRVGLASDPSERHRKVLIHFITKSLRLFWRERIMSMSRGDLLDAV